METATVYKGDGIRAFRFASIKAQLKLEKLGLKSSGGPLRPRLQPQPEFSHLKVRDSHDKYIAVCEEVIAACGYADKD